MHGYFPPEPAADTRRRITLGAVAGGVLACVLMIAPIAVSVVATVHITPQIAPSHRHDGLLVASFDLALVLGLYALLVATVGLVAPRKRLPRLASLPQGSVTSRADGEVAMIAGSLLSGPDAAETLWSGRPCVWSELRLTPFRSGKTRSREKTIVRARLGTIRVACEDEEIEVDASGALVRGTPHKEDAPLDGPRSSELRALLTGAGVSVAGLSGVEIEERSAGAGDAVVVVGVVRRGDAYRDGLRLASGPQDRLMITTESREALVRAHALEQSRRFVFIALGVAAVLLGSAYLLMQVLTTH